MSVSTTLAQCLARRAETDGDAIAYTFLADGAADARSLTWRELDVRARSRAAAMRARGAAGERVLLTLPSGLAYVESLFACWHAGATAVPISLPRSRRVQSRLHGIVADADARFAIGTAEVRQQVDAEAADAPRVTWLDFDGATALPPDSTSPVDASCPAVLQYTSGSTGTPRGVVVTHANLIHNCQLIADACGHGPGQTIGGWLPLFHDMGLVGLVIQAVVSGARCVFMPPERFLMRPWLWPRMISDYRICSSPAPNFAYDLCVDRVSEEQRSGLDLSCWRNALNGSEPVRPATLSRFAATYAPSGFRRDAFFPCYGLAEATLFVTGPSSGSRRALRRTADGEALPEGSAEGHVGCGRPQGDTRVEIVDPATRCRVPDGAVGEIWVAGASCASGYWRDPAATARTFEGRRADSSDDSTRWLRTGDLGRFADGELFITGRLRELIIVAGRNLFPVDIERTAEAAHPAIASSGVAAFAADVGGVERLIVVAEARRGIGRRSPGELSEAIDVDAIVRQVRAAIVLEHEVAPYDVIVVKSGALERTTSGKLMRGAIRDGYLAATLDRWEEHHASVAR